MRCSLMPFSRRIAATSRWLESSSPTAPSISSSVPSRMLASGVFSSCDMWRRKRLRSCASSSRRLRSHSSCPPSRSRSCGPETTIGLVKLPSPSSLIARSSWRSGRPTPMVSTNTATTASGSSSVPATAGACAPAACAPRVRRPPCRPAALLCCATRSTSAVSCVKRADRSSAAAVPLAAGVVITAVAMLACRAPSSSRVSRASGPAWPCSCSRVLFRRSSCAR